MRWRRHILIVHRRLLFATVASSRGDDAKTLAPANAGRSGMCGSVRPEIGEGNMNFKHTVLLTAAIATLTGCAADGDKKSDAATAVPADRAAAVEPTAATAPLAAAPIVVASGEPAVVTSPAPAPITEVVPAPAAPEQPASPAPASPPPPAAAPPRQEPLAERSSAARAAADKPATPSSVVLDRTPHVFNVTVETKDASHPNYGRGVPMGFVVDGTPGKELALTRSLRPPLRRLRWCITNAAITNTWAVKFMSATPAKKSHWACHRRKMTKKILR